MNKTYHQTLLHLHQGDITQFPAEGIINAANSALRGGSGVDGAIHRVGGASIMQECRLIKGGCPTGSAVSTTAGDLPARRVIHAVGPIWQGGRKKEAELLASAYSACLAIAEEEGLTTLAFPSLSTGAYGYPIEQACGVALTAVQRHLDWFDSDTILRQISFILFTPADYAIYAAELDRLFA
jgi:O-acetyl-ADP-ribose deacetylase